MFIIRHPHLLSGFPADSDQSIYNDDDITKLRDIRGDTYNGGDAITLEFESQVDSQAFKNNYYEVCLCLYVCSDNDYRYKLYYLFRVYLNVI